MHKPLFMARLIHPVLILVIVIVGSLAELVAAPTLSPSAKISLLTCDPGNELYSTFGHSAIWVHDPEYRIDRVYNYGTFDFNTPNFYLKFCQGKLNYKLDVDSYREFDYAYKYFKRSFHEDVFDLTLSQKQAVFDYLENNYQPENRFYLYDFFFDNCATRIKDVFVDVLGDSLRLSQNYTDSTLTFRNMIDIYLDGKYWEDFGIDLALGSVIDRRATPEEQMFLPDYLAEGLTSSEILRDGQWIPLVKQEQTLYNSDAAKRQDPIWMHPALIFWLLFLVVAYFSWKEFTAGQRRKGLDITLYLIFGLAGLIIALLWFATDHTATGGNFHLLWALPTHLIVGIILFRQQPAWLKTYALVSAILCGITLLGWDWLIQDFNAGILPLVLMIGGRNLMIWWMESGKK
jgi:hypothetical protein